MKLIKCPEVWTPNHDQSVFLAGGITGCPDWQTDMVDLLASTDFTLLNPRREKFDITNTKLSDQQIEWEFDHLYIADAVLFWFPCETLCPISLYELGSCASLPMQIFVGCHPDYARKFDVIKQLSLARPEIIVAGTLQELADQIKLRKINNAD